MAKQQRLVFVIDEYLYLAKAEKSFSSQLQHIIDHQWQDRQPYLILCGSSMSFMEDQVLGYESPLYGRRTAEFKIQALTYREMTKFHPNLLAQDQAFLYGVMGAFPIILISWILKTIWTMPFWKICLIPQVIFLKNRKSAETGIEGTCNL